MLLDKINKTLAPMLTKKRKLRSPLPPVAKKLTNDKVTDAVDRVIIMPMMDAGMDTILTPNW